MRNLSCQTSCYAFWQHGGGKASDGADQASKRPIGTNQYSEGVDTTENNVNTRPDGNSRAARRRAGCARIGVGRSVTDCVSSLYAVDLMEGFYGLVSFARNGGKFHSLRA
jgi:hypothetical protein